MQNRLLQSSIMTLTSLYSTENYITDISTLVSPLQSNTDLAHTMFAFPLLLLITRISAISSTSFSIQENPSVSSSPTTGPGTSSMNSSSNSSHSAIIVIAQPKGRTMTLRFSAKHRRSGVAILFSMYCTVIQKSNMNEQLLAAKEGREESEVAGEYGSKPLYRTL